jgi:hypothetical protein
MKEKTLVSYNKVTMETNLLIAIANLIKDPVIDLRVHYVSSNRANSMGDALEFYVKDLFCGTLQEKSAAKRDEAYKKYFSHLGSQNHPPDAMIRGGDAIEIKKIEKLFSGIALNSSYPKDRLYADSRMITAKCKKAEDWKEKDLVYAVGVAAGGKLKSLWFVYGNCYAARKEIYEETRGFLIDGIEALPNVEHAKTRELGRVNKVDPLYITHLRIRGMWGIENPAKVFSYIVSVAADASFFMNALMLKNKYDAFPRKERIILENIKDDRFAIKDVKIKSPNDPDQWLDAKLLSFSM